MSTGATAEREGVAAQDLTAVVTRAERGEATVILDGDGKPVAAVIPFDDFGLLERLLRDEEDRLDVAAAEQALAEAEREGWVPWEEVKAELAAARGGEAAGEASG